MYGFICGLCQGMGEKEPKSVETSLRLDAVFGRIDGWIDQSNTYLPSRDRIYTPFHAATTILQGIEQSPSARISYATHGASIAN